METDTTPESVEGSGITDAELRLLEACGIIEPIDDPCEYCGRSDVRDNAALDAMRQRAELAESRLAALNARVNAADAAARAKRDRFETHPTLRDWREGQAR